MSDYGVMIVVLIMDMGLGGVGGDILPFSSPIVWYVTGDTCVVCDV